MARQILSHFVVKTDATFNINRPNMPLSVLIGITNTRLSLLAEYCYISFKSRETFCFMFACMQRLLLYDEFLGRYIIQADFTASFGAAMIKTLNQNELSGGEAQIARNIAQCMNKF